MVIMGMKKCVDGSEGSPSADALILTATHPPMEIFHLLVQPLRRSLLAGVKKTLRKPLTVFPHGDLWGQALDTQQ